MAFMELPEVSRLKGALEYIGRNDYQSELMEER
jgi:hypothetical protein